MYLPAYDIKVHAQFRTLFSFLKGSKVRFMDTMSLHMAISGLTGFQRTLWMANKLGKRKGLQEVKEHIKKAGKKKEGPMVCVLLFTIFQLQKMSLVVNDAAFLLLKVSRSFGWATCDMMCLCIDWLLGLGEYWQH